MRCRDCSGFTLLEMLIGLTLLGFIVSLLLAGFRLGATSWDAMEERSDRNVQQQVSRAFLKRVLADTYPLRLKQTPGQPMAFSGRQDGLRLVSVLPAQLGTGGLRWVELSVEKDEADNLRLLFRHAAVNYDDRDVAMPEDEKPAVLLHGARSISIGYFGAEKKGGESQWTERWASPDQLPRLIRLQAEFGDGTLWPDLLVELRLNEGGCLWDDFHKRCIYQ